MAPDHDKLIKAVKAADRKVERTKAAYDAATRDRAEKIAAAVEGGISQNGLARELGKSVSRVRQILERERRV